MMIDPTRQPCRPLVRVNWGTLLLGASLIATGVAFLTLASDIRQLGLGNNRDPGPKAFPMLLAGLLSLGGLLEVVLGLTGMSHFGQRREPPLVTSPSDLNRPRVEIGRAVILLIVLTAYIAAIDWIGFSLSTFLTASGLMIWMQTASARRSTVARFTWIVVSLVLSFLLVATIQLLFVQVFRVQLPTGAMEWQF
jgi:hypothetical protein